ncbi:Uncharacterised protein [Vibrio cholerae]|nr:Uncharacterised protein [Vibrio cholerae]
MASIYCTASAPSAAPTKVQAIANRIAFRLTTPLRTK